MQKRKNWILIGFFTFVFMFGVMFGLTGCGSDNPNVPDEHQEQDVKTLTSLDLSISPSLTDKYYIYEFNTIHVQHGTVLHTDDVCLTNITVTYSDNSIEQIDPSQLLFQGMPANDTFVWSQDFQQYTITVSYQTVSAQIYVCVDKLQLNFNPVTIQMSDILTSTKSDSNGKYIDLYDCNITTEEGVTLASLVDAGYVTQLNDNENKVYHGTGYDGAGDLINQYMGLEISPECPYEGVGHSTNLEIYYNVAPVVLSRPTVKDLPLDNSQSNPMTFEFDHTKYQGPELELPVSESQYLAYLTSSSRGYAPMNYVSSSVSYCVIDGCYNDFTFEDGVIINSGTVDNVYWQITPKTFITMPTLQTTIKVWDGEQLQNPSFDNVPQILQQFIQGTQTQDWGGDVGEHAICFDVSYNSSSDGAPQYAEYYASYFRFYDGEQYLYLNEIIFEYEITKAPYSLPEDYIRQGTNRVQINVQYGDFNSAEGFVAAFSSNPGDYFLPADYSNLVTKGLFNNYGYIFSPTEYLTDSLFTTIGQHSVTIDFAPDGNHYSDTMLVLLNVTKADVYVKNVDWHYDWSGYTYTGSAQSVPYVTQWNSDDIVFDIAYQTYVAEYNVGTSSWVPSGAPIQGDIVNAGEYITLAILTNAHYRPSNLTDSDLQYHWTVAKVSGDAPELNNYNYDGYLDGNFYGSYDKPTGSGYNTIKQRFSYYTGSAKTITINDYFTTGAGHYDYYTSISLTHEYSADGSTNWTPKSPAELTEVGYYRSTLTFTCDDNHQFDYYGGNTVSGIVEWRILPEVYEVNTINFGSTPTTYDAIDSQWGGIYPVLPDDAAPEYFDVEYTRYFKHEGNWVQFYSGTRDNIAGEYKVVATLKAIPNYDGATGVTYRRDGVVIKDSEDSTQNATEFTVELIYEVIELDNTHFDLPDYLADNNMIVSYLLEPDATPIDSADFAASFSAYNTNVDFDNTIIVYYPEHNDYTSWNVRNLDVNTHNSHAYFAVVQSSITSGIACAIDNCEITDIVNDGYMTITMTYTPYSGVYAPKEFTVRFYIANKYNFELPSYLDNGNYTMMYEYRSDDTSTYTKDQFLDYVFNGWCVNLINTDMSFHIDNTRNVEDTGKTSLVLMNELITEYGDNIYFTLPESAVTTEILNAVNNHEAGEYELTMEISPDIFKYFYQIVTVKLIIRERPAA